MSAADSVVQPRYQDRRACPKCGSLLARWCSEQDDGHILNTPGMGSPRWVEGHLRPGDVIEHTIEVSAGHTSDTKTIRMVRYDYFCEVCNEDLYPSLTVPWSGELPASAYYEPESPEDRRARFARSRERFEKTLVEE
jgi:hypothetical protein